MFISSNHVTVTASNACLAGIGLQVLTCTAPTPGRAQPRYYKW